MFVLLVYLNSGKTFGLHRARVQHFSVRIGRIQILRGGGQSRSACARLDLIACVHESILSARVLQQRRQCVPLQCVVTAGNLFAVTRGE